MKPSHKWWILIVEEVLCKYKVPGGDRTRAFSWFQGVTKCLSEAQRVEQVSLLVEGA